ncbi:MAG: YraN family protein [Candidatus Omnitrophota bacterium]
MSKTRQNIGKTGEHLAETYLSSRGFVLLEKNLVTPFGEIDLIAKDKDYLVFIEVRTLTSEIFGTPLESIGKIKRQHILKNCQYYMSKRHLHNKYWRIDVIGIKLDRSLSIEYLTHVKNAIVVQG